MLFPAKSRSRISANVHCLGGHGVSHVFPSIRARKARTPSLRRQAPVYSGTGQQPADRIHNGGAESIRFGTPFRAVNQSVDCRFRHARKRLANCFLLLISVSRPVRQALALDTLKSNSRPFPIGNAGTRVVVIAERKFAIVTHNVIGYHLPR